MGQQIHLEGQVKIFKHKNNRGKLGSSPFKLSVKKPEIVDCLMSKFKNFNFSEKEKQLLSAKHRELICEYTQIKDNDLTKYSNKLIKELKKYKDEVITIKASDFGAFVCLAAIFSGKLPQEQNWNFELSSTPVKLFPKSLVKDKFAAESYNVSFIVESDCWLKPFKSLSECPSYMSFSWLHHENEENLMSVSAA